MRHRTLSALLALALLAAALAGCAAPEPRALRLATTTSTEDSGLLTVILPDFEEAFNARVDVVAVGTGQAIELGRNGDADVILVHSPSRERAFVEEGFGRQRHVVMYNDFVLVGPADDPAGIAALGSAAEALATLAAARAPFASRGDDSGTHSKELSLWEAAGLAPDPAQGWYLSLGQGMGETLLFANERRAYTLADRGTFLAQRDNLPDLKILFGGQTIAENPDPALYNPYGVIAVNPDLHEGIRAELAADFIAWLISVETQEQIAAFGLEQFGQPLFYPDSAPYRQAHP